jgi:hypothetical protein
MARARQPQGPARVDPSYPYAKNLRGAWLASGTAPLQNASNRGGLGDLTAVGSPLFVPTPYGIGVSLNGSSQYLTNTSNAAITSYPFTFFLWVYMSSAQSGSARVMDISIGTGVTVVAGLRYGDGEGYRVQHYDGANSQTDPINPAKGAWHSLAGRFTSTSARSFFFDGALVGTNTDTRSAFSGIDRLTIGWAPWGSEYLNGIVAVPLAFDAALPSEEIALLHQNPYRWAAPQRRPFIFDFGANQTTTTSAITIPRSVPRTRQPRTPTQLRADLRSGALTLWCGSTPTVDLLNRPMVTTLSANLLPEVSSAGQGLLHQNSAVVWYYAGLKTVLSGATGFTHVSIVRKQNAGNGLSPFEGWVSGGNQLNYKIAANGEIQFGVYKDGSNVLIRKSATGVIQTGKTYTIVVGWKPGTLSCYVDGVAIDLPNDVWVTGSPTALASVSGNIGIGPEEENWGAAGYALNVSWLRFLPDQQSISANPWELFAPQRRPFIFFEPEAGGTTTTESVSSRLKARGSETSTPIRAEVATSRRKARGAATVTAIKAEAVTGRRKARGAATTTIALRTESGVGRVKARGTTTVTHIDAGAVVESVAGRRQIRASVAVTPIRTEAVIARRKARGSDTVTLTRTEAVVARRKARGVANAAPLVAGMITESVASRLSARASSTATTTRIEAVTARRQARGTAIINGIREALAAGRRRLRGVAAAAPYVAPTLPVEIPESSRTVNAQEVRIGASPTRKATPRLG